MSATGEWVRRGELPPRFSVATSNVDGYVIVSVEGELDRSTVGLVRREAARAPGRPAASLILDLGRTTFMDVSGVRLIIELGRDAGATAADFAIVVTSRPVRRVLEILPIPCPVRQVESLEQAMGGGREALAG